MALTQTQTAASCPGHLLQLSCTVNMSVTLPNHIQAWVERLGEWHCGRTTADKRHVKNVENIVRRGSPVVPPVNGEQHGAALQQGVNAVLTSCNICVPNWC